MYIYDTLEYLGIYECLEYIWKISGWYPESRKTLTAHPEAQSQHGGCGWFIHRYHWDVANLNHGGVLLWTLDSSRWMGFYLEYIWNVKHGVFFLKGGDPQFSSIYSWDFPWKPSMGYPSQETSSPGTCLERLLIMVYPVGLAPKESAYGDDSF